MAHDSKQIWFKDSCVQDPIMKGVDAKVLHMSMVPINNAKYMQLLKYNAFKYYKTHSDYNPILLQKQTSLRILTTYLYLNNIEGSGYTNFPNLNITVQQ